MAMLPRFILVWMAMAMVATALAVSANMISKPTRILNKRTPLPHGYGVRTPNTLRTNKETKESENTYTTQQMEQFQAGHSDVLMVCETAVEEATKTPDRFNKIFRQYLPFSDRQLVIDVIKSILDTDGEGKGNPEFKEIDIVDDYPSIYDKQELFCKSGDVAWAGSKQDDRGQHRVQIILCPPFFEQGTFNGGPNREWPGILTPKCSNIAYRVPPKMNTLGSPLLHEYTHVDELVQPLLCERVEDHEYGYYDTRELALTEPDITKHNANSYAAFATELTWSKLCDRDFEAPLEDDHAKLPAPGTRKADAKGADIKETEEKATDNQSSSTKQQRPRHEFHFDPSLDKRTAFSQAYQHPIPKTNVDNTYTVEQMDQFLGGHIDALQLCRVALKQSTKNPTRFDKIFREYFDPNDRALVINVFKTILDIRGTNQGSPKIGDIEIVDDFKPDEEIAKKYHLPKDRRCRPKSYALTSDHKTPTRMILCPLFFTRGTIGKSVTCDTVGTRVGPAMATRGHTVLHEYTHVTEVMQPIFGHGIPPRGKTDDHAYGFDGCRKLQKDQAWDNADSYTSFATELFWTTTCDRDFESSLPAGASSSPDELKDVLAGLDLDRTTKGESSAKGESSKKGDSTAKGDSAAKGSSSGKGRLVQERNLEMILPEGDLRRAQVRTVILQVE